MSKRSRHTDLDLQRMSSPVSLLLLNGILLLDALGCARQVLAPGCLCSFQGLHLHLVRQLIIIEWCAKVRSNSGEQGYCSRGSCHSC